MSLLVDGASARPGDRGRRQIAAYARNARALKAFFAGEKGPALNPNVEPDSLLLRFVEAHQRSA